MEFLLAHHTTENRKYKVFIIKVMQLSLNVVRDLKKNMASKFLKFEIL